jgi:hypothetical protein
MEHIRRNNRGVHGTRIGNDRIGDARVIEDAIPLLALARPDRCLLASSEEGDLQQV